MVNKTPKSANLNLIFQALADPTRRQILDQISRYPDLRIGQISAPHQISSPAISKHLKVLEKSGLIKRRIDGRIHRFQVAPEPFEQARDWLAAYLDFRQKNLTHHQKSGVGRGDHKRYN